MINIFWFRRDLRLLDNHGLWQALNAGLPVLPVFIFDSEILDKLNSKSDARVQFIHEQLKHIQFQLQQKGKSLLVLSGKPMDVFKQLTEKYQIANIFTNSDYEPYGIQRDNLIKTLLNKADIGFKSFKDHVIFDPLEVLKADGKPYTVYTPYSRKWKEKLLPQHTKPFHSESLLDNLLSDYFELPNLEEIGMMPSPVFVPPIKLDDKRLQSYHETRNFPALTGTSLAGPHLRFGTIGIRHVVDIALHTNETYLNELIWREFFMQILYHFPKTVTHNFYSKYDPLEWKNNPEEFQAWCDGKTGYPLVDAGMRELLATGNMHNRVRMVVASFLTKHLLIDWRWGEAWFASKLLDFELSSNVGNWQWAAGTGCDAAPYFRVFNPSEQIKKFDKYLTYVRKWVPELEEFRYPKPIIEHSFARDRAISAYKKALSGL
ncbi:MAG: deoxyribodipyrimidine photolyase [Bacteroidetes bacterium]|nr:MAG: deoxyribodipyrimidine photolyase [Bacteroidota bacterium]